VEIAVYVPNIEALLNVEEALRGIAANDIPGFVYNVVFWDRDSIAQYDGNLAAIEVLDKLQASGAEIRRLYFGQEFCQYLIPSASDLEQAYSLACQLGWRFTYVTGYLTDAGLAKVRHNLETLLSSANNPEVVVNDWGLLRLLARDFPTVVPVLGRLLTKQKRLGRFTSANAAPPANLADLSTPELEIRRNQLRVWREIGVSREPLRRELHELGVHRVDLDIVPQGVRIEPDQWGLSFSCYFPWAYMTGGRNCLTGALADPRRRYVVLDTPCPRPCQHVTRSSLLHHFPQATIQRGNSVFVFALKYAPDYLDGTIPVDRLVFQPYIPI